MRVLFAGTPEVAVPSFQAILSSGMEVVGVLTRPDAPAGRGRKLTLSPVALAAEDAGIPVIRSSRPHEASTLDAVRACGADVAAVVAYGALLRREVLEAVPHGWLNLHFSLLPQWRGAAPVQHAILAGDAMTGATVFQLDEGLDTGPVLGTMTEPIRPEDTAGSLLDRLARAGAPLLVQALGGLVSGQLQAIAQDADGVSHAPKIAVEDARVRWTDPAFAVDRRIRAVTPEPGAWTTFRGERLKLGPVTPMPDTDPLVIAAIGAVPEGARAGALQVSKRAVIVSTGSGWVRLGQVSPHGKKTMDAADWARGVRIEHGEDLQ